ncbi:MAG: hypothetical protein V3V33_13065 [Candidatus Lokiarchaeia archaeon]
MSEIKFEKKEKPEEFIRAEQLSDEGKLDDALTLLNNYEQKEGLTHNDKVSCHLLQCKIMKRILKAIAAGTDIGNVTTLADPSVVDALLEERKKMDVEIG